MTIRSEDIVTPTAEYPQPSGKNAKVRRRGVVLGRARFPNCWRVRWDNIANTEIIHEDFLRSHGEQRDEPSENKRQQDQER